MPKILIIDMCGECKYIPLGSNKRCRHPMGNKEEEIWVTKIPPEWCPLEEEDNKLRAKWFEKGQMSIKRKNKSGCCCIIDEDLGDKVVSVCGAHQTWMEEQLPDAEVKE